MRYVLGMAKSSLDTRGGKGRNLELDFVRLVLAVRTRIATGATAHGYLLVLDERVAARACGWREKYEAKDLVTVFVYAATASEHASLLAEKRLNAAAITSPGSSLPSESAALVGQNIAENALRLAIEAKESVKPEAPAGFEWPLHVRWDYFGIIHDDDVPACVPGRWSGEAPQGIREVCGPEGNGGRKSERDTWRAAG